MPKVLIERPNRSHSRPFTRDDAARVICRVLRSPGPGNTGKGSGSSILQRRGQTVFDHELRDILNRVEVKCGARLQFDRPLTAAEAAIVQGQEQLPLTVDAIGTLEKSAEAVTDSNTVILSVVEFLGAVLTFLSVVLTVLTFIPIPQARLVAVGARAMVTRIDGFIVTMLRQRAANDAQWSLIQRTLGRLKAA